MPYRILIGDPGSVEQILNTEKEITEIIPMGHTYIPTTISGLSGKKQMLVPSVAVIVKGEFKNEEVKVEEVKDGIPSVPENPKTE